MFSFILGFFAPFALLIILAALGSFGPTTRNSGLTYDEWERQDEEMQDQYAEYIRDIGLD